MGWSRDARLGLVSVLIVLIVGYGMTMVTSASYKKNFGTIYHLIFARVEGISEGNKVYYNGRLVGRVRSLSVVLADAQKQDGAARYGIAADITISITPSLTSSSVVLTRDSSYTVEGGGLFGEKWINIQYQPGEVIPPGGQVRGQSVPAFTHLMYHGTRNLNELIDMISYYKKQLGSGEKAREKVKALVNYWNDAAFDLRVQANRFNQFSGLINEQIEKGVGMVDRRIVAMRAQAQMMVSQLQLQARAMQVAAVRQDQQAQAMVAKLTGQMHAMRASVRGLGVFIVSGDKMISSLLETARKRVQDAQDMVAAVRFISKNPRMAEHFRLLAANMRKKAAELKAMIDALRKKTAPAEKAPPEPEPPLPSQTDGAPPAPGVPMPPTLPLPASSSVPQSSPASSPETPAPSPTGH